MPKLKYNENGDFCSCDNSMQEAQLAKAGYCFDSPPEVKEKPVTKKKASKKKANK